MRKYTKLKILGMILLANATISAMNDDIVTGDMIEIPNVSAFLSKVDAWIKKEADGREYRRDPTVFASVEINSFLKESEENGKFPSSSELDGALTEAVKIEDNYLVKAFFQEFLGNAWQVQPSQQAVSGALSQANNQLKEAHETKKKNSRLNWAGKPDKNGYTAPDRLAYYPAKFSKTLPERIESLDKIIKFLETKIQN